MTSRVLNIVFDVQKHQMKVCVWRQKNPRRSPIHTFELTATKRKQNKKTSREVVMSMAELSGRMWVLQPDKGDPHEDENYEVDEEAKAEAMQPYIVVLWAYDMARGGYTKISHTMTIFDIQFLPDFLFVYPLDTIGVCDVFSLSIFSNTEKSLLAGAHSLFSSYEAFTRVLGGCGDDAVIRTLVLLVSKVEDGDEKTQLRASFLGKVMQDSECIRPSKTLRVLEAVTEKSWREFKAVDYDTLEAGMMDDFD